MPPKRLTEAFVEHIKPTPNQQIDYFDQGLRGLTLRVSYGGTKTWRALYYVHGKPKTFKLGRYPTLPLKEAREKARLFLANPLSVLNGVAAGAFEDVVAKFLKHHVEANGLRTRAKIERCFEKYVLPRWKGRLFVEISRSDVTALLDELVEKNGNRQADIVLAHIRKMMHWHETRTDNYVSPIVRGMQRTPASQRKRARILTDEEIRSFWVATGAMGTFGSLCRILLLTLQRREKVTQMKRAHVVGNRWNIETEEREKGNATSLTLPQTPLTILNALPALQGNPFYFPASHGQGPINSFSQKKAELDQAMRLTLGSLPKWTLHDLRRTSRSLLSRAGVRREISERVLGHAIAGVEGVYDRYTYDAEKRDALMKLETLLLSIIHSSETVTESDAAPFEKHQLEPAYRERTPRTCFS